MEACIGQTIHASEREVCDSNLNFFSIPLEQLLKGEPTSDTNTTRPSITAARSIPYSRRHPQIL
jgi:hypothetical protein